MHRSSGAPSLILASESPRRRDLLEQAGLTFRVVPSAVEESRITAASPHARVRLLAEAKAMEVATRNPASWVIGADTVVVVGGEVLGKPATPQDARQMLERLSARSHKVLTGYAVCCRQANRSFSDVAETTVFFKALTGAEIEWYVSTDEPYDKAGGYAIQGLATTMVKRIEGSYTNVVGLPVCEVVDYLIREKAVQR